MAEPRMVCRRFLQETLQHLAENNLFVVSRCIGNTLTLRKDFLRHVRFIRLQWNAYEDTSRINLCALCPGLRHLQLQIDNGVLAMKHRGVAESLHGFCENDVDGIGMLEAMSLARPGSRVFRID